MWSIKVGINEWIVVNNHNASSLWTDGLSGCVGVAIVVPGYAFLTHIDSHISVQDWQQNVEAHFLAALTNLGHLAQADVCEVVIGDDAETPLADAVLRTLRTTWTTANNTMSDPEMTLKRTGVRLHCVTGGQFQLQSLARMGHQVAWGTHQNSVLGAAHIAFQGFFPGGATADL